MCIRSAPVVYLVAMMALITNVGCPPSSNFPFSTETQTPSVYASITTNSFQPAVGESESAGVDISGATGTVSYQWSITPPGVIVENSTEAIVNFTASGAETVTLSVTATDSGTGTSTTSSTQIDFVEAPTPLIVDAGPDVTVKVGETVLLFGSVSGGTGGSSINQIWRQTSGPLQELAPDYSGGYGPITVVGTTPGTVVFELIVSDYDGTIATDMVNVVVTAK